MLYKVKYIVPILLIILNLIETYRLTFRRDSQIISKLFSQTTTNENNENSPETQELKELIKNLEKGSIPIDEFQKQVIKKEDSVKLKKSQAEKELILASATGGGVLGFFLGTLLDLGTLDYDIPLYALPLTTSSLLAGGILNTFFSIRYFLSEKKNYNY